MPDSTPSQRDFSQRLWLNGGRDQIPPNALRRCVGAASEVAPSVVSRPGSTSLITLPNVSALTKFAGTRYQHDGTSLYKAGSSIDSGYNGNRVTFLKAPPALGLPSYLFVAGGGKLRKVDQSGNVTNWGIAAPPDAMTATLLTADTIVIDTFNGHSANWTHTNATLTDDNTEFQVNNPNDSGGSLNIAPAGSPWRITNTFAATPQNWNYYSSTADFSLGSDIFSFWFFIDTDLTPKTGWLQLDIDVNDGSFKKDYYTYAIGLIPAGAIKAVVKHNVNVDYNYAPNQWQLAVFPKSAMVRTGTNLQFDWSCVQALRFSGQAGIGNLKLDYFTLSGGDGKGQGPAAGFGGSAYDYYVTYRNTTTGNDSNPHPDPCRIFGVSVNQVSLQRIPLSGDAQVNARDLWRSSAENQVLGLPAFYLDTIYDNTTTSYTDKTADIAQPLVTTPWQKSTLVPPANKAAGASYFVDGGNGYYFKLTTNGTTGATLPAWVVPTTKWVALGSFAAGATIAPLSAAPNFFQVTTPGVGGATPPNWAAVAVGNSVTDGTVVWQNLGARTTTDNTAVWTFQGLNATPALGSQQLNLDNLQLPATIGDAVYYQGSIYAARDSAAGAQGYVYASPPGRCEGYGVILNATSSEDATQKLFVYDDQLFLLTTLAIYPITGSYPNLQVGQPLEGAVGTSFPFTVKDTPVGVVYRAAEDLRIFSRAGSQALGFDALAPILRGNSAENVAAFNPIIAEHTRDEILFSDGTQCFGFNLPHQVWRMLGALNLNAFFYEDDSGIIEAANPAQVLSLEVAGAATDAGAAIAIEWQTASLLPDASALTLVKRVWVDINCNGQVITPVLLTDGVEVTLPAITSLARKLIAIPNLQAGAMLGLRLTGSLTAPVELFGVWPELRVAQKAA